MLRIIYGRQDRLRLLLSPTLISGLFRPVLHNSPICSESRVLPGFLCKRRSKTSNVQQFGEVVYVIPCCLFRREFVLHCLSGDARLQAALDGITRNVVGSGESPGLEQDGGIVQSLGGQAPKFESIHPCYQDIAVIARFGNVARPSTPKWGARSN